MVLRSHTSDSFSVWVASLSAGFTASLCVGQGRVFGRAFTYHYSAAQVCPAVKVTLGLKERFHKPLLRDH